MYGTAKNFNRKAYVKPAVTNRGELIPCCWMDQVKAH